MGVGAHPQRVWRPGTWHPWVMASQVMQLILTSQVVKQGPQSVPGQLHLCGGGGGER